MIIEQWGEVNYVEAVDKQLQIVSRVSSGDQDDTLIFCQHPPVVTLGKKSDCSDILNWSGPRVKVSRGGRATYHGPGQLVIYPIFKISSHDVHAFLRTVEKAIIHALLEIDIKGESLSEKYKNIKNDRLSYTGVWVGDSKIASVGIAVKKWVSYHGAALNIYIDDLAFTGIQPCGFSREQMTSIEQCLGEKVDSKELVKSLQYHFNNLF